MQLLFKNQLENNTSELTKVMVEIGSISKHTIRSTTKLNKIDGAYIFA